MPDRIRFDSFPYPSMALRVMPQMKRWGEVKGDLRWRDVAEQVFLAAGAEANMKNVGLATPSNPYRSFQIIGKIFDLAIPEGYLNSYPVRRT